MKVSLITPERRIFTDREAEEVQVPSKDGYLGILPGHFPLMGTLGVGILELNGKEKYAVEGGFFQFERGELIVLAKLAWRPEELKRKELEKEREKALEILRTSSNPEEVERASYQFTRASVFLTLFKA